MEIFLATLAFFAVAMGAMAVGLVRGRRLSGSCGGSDLEGRPIGECVCGKPSDERCSIDPKDLEGLTAERSGS